VVTSNKRQPSQAKLRFLEALLWRIWERDSVNSTPWTRISKEIS
jgi:hypothetical protein